MKEKRGPSAAIWMMLCCLMPIVAIYALAAMGIVVSPFLLLMMLCWMAMGIHCPYL